MAMQPHPREDAPGLPSSPNPQRGAAEPEHRKATFLKEVLEGLPGYYEPPPEVRKDKLPAQRW